MPKQAFYFSMMQAMISLHERRIKIKHCCISEGFIPTKNEEGR